MEGKKLKHVVLLSILVVLFTSAIVCADPISEVVGPYKISFDLGLPHNSYYGNVSTKESESLSGAKETIYIINIYGEGTLLWKPEIEIDLTQYNYELKILSATELENILKGILSNQPLSGYATATREIDGTVGAIASHNVNKILYSEPWYSAIYYPTCDNHLVCTIDSSFPWDEGTLNLLKTIHIEKVS
jgi:hypothetical protein